MSLGLRPLHYACYRDYIEAARLLIVRGAKVDCTDDIGYTIIKELKKSIIILIGILLFIFVPKRAI